MSLLLVIGLIVPAFAAQGAGEPTIFSAAWSSDGSRLAVGGLDRITIFSLETPESPVSLQDAGLRASGGIAGLAWHPDGGALAAARYDGLVVIWGKTGGTWARTHTLRGHIGAANGVAWSPDGALIASAGDDLMVRLWDAGTGAPLAVLKKHRARAISVAFLNTATLISGGADNWCLLWEVQAGQSPATPQGHRGRIVQIAPAPDGAQYATASADGTARVWRSGGEPVAVLQGHDGAVIGVGWRAEPSDPGEFTLLTVGTDNTLRIWHSARAESAARDLFPLDLAAPARGAVFSANGAQVAVWESSAQVAVIDTRTGQVMARLNMP